MAPARPEDRCGRRGDRTRLARHILPILGKLDVRGVNRDDLKRLVVDLDGKAARGHSDDGNPLSSKTASNVWSVTLALFRDAQKAKDPALCVREDNRRSTSPGPKAV